MAERLGQVIYWMFCGIAAAGAIGAVFWLINGVLYEGDEVAFTIAAVFSVSAVVSYFMGRAVSQGGLLRQRFRGVALWFNDLVERLVRWLWIAGGFRNEKKQ